MHSVSTPPTTPATAASTVADSRLLAPEKARAQVNWMLGAGLCLLFAVYLGSIGAFPLVGRDEPRYAQVAREMWQSHDWITPRLGGHTWFEKPALLYWMLAASFSLFGVSEWTVRLAPALCGLGTVVLVWGMVARVRADWAQWSALALATSGGLMAFAHGATFDIVLTLCVTLALAGFWRAQIETDPTLARHGLVLLWVGVGLAFLAKGLVAFILCGGTVGLYALVRREKVRTGWLWGLPLALLVSAAWYGPVTWRNGWTFINQFFVHHHFQRFLTNEFKHQEPFWFYGPMLLLLALPWTPALLWALFRLRLATLRASDNESKLLALGLCWMLVPVAFFSLSGSKLPGYILPALPGAFILVGLGVAHFARQPLGRRVSLGVACAMLLGVLVGANSKFGVERAEHESVRSVLRAAQEQGMQWTRVTQLDTMQRGAQFYAAEQLLYGADGEPLRLRTPQAVAAILHGDPLLVIASKKATLELAAFGGVRTQQVAQSGKVFLLMVRPLQTAH